MGQMKVDDVVNAAGSGAPKFSKGIDLSQAAGYTKTLTSAKSADYTVTATDGIETLLVTAASNVTITLPAAASSTGRTLTIKKVDSGTGIVTVDGNAAETIDGDLTKKIPFQYNFMTIACDGTGWHIVQENRRVVFSWLGNGSSQSLTKGVDTTITSLTATVDPLVSYTSTGKFIVQETGYYHFAANFVIYAAVSVSAVSFAAVNSAIYVNSSIVSGVITNQPSNSTINSLWCHNHNFYMKLNSGDNFSFSINIDWTGGSLYSPALNSGNPHNARGSIARIFA